jgi:hypothetical protein
MNSPDAPDRASMDRASDQPMFTTGLVRERMFDKTCCDCSHMCPACCIITIGVHIGAICCLPQALSAMIKKIGWNGTSPKLSSHIYSENKQCFVYLLGLIMMLSVLYFLVPVPDGAIRTVLGVLLSLVFSFYMLALVLLRYRMRKALHVRPECCTCGGDVGGFFEDLICMTIFSPCALSQMMNEVDVRIDICKEPEDVDSGIRSFDLV